MLVSLFVLVFAYLSGSICAAVLVSHIFALPDPRTDGSKNPGATNVLRLSGKKYAAIVLFVDMLKGFLPVLLARWLGESFMVIGFTCFLAVLGHMYPVFFRFQGGKGVATAIGVLFGLHLMLGVWVVGVWLVVAKYTRYSSLASMIAIGLSPLFAAIFDKSFDLFPSIFMIALFIFYKHRQNLTRLVEGTEPQLFSNKSDSETV